MALHIPKIVFKRAISLVIIRPHDGFVFRPVRVWKQVEHDHLYREGQCLV